jgi:hypothetical protein
MTICDPVRWSSFVAINCEDFTAKALGFNYNLTAELAGAKHDQPCPLGGAWNSELGTGCFAHL